MAIENNFELHKHEFNYTAKLTTAKTIFILCLFVILPCFGFFLSYFKVMSFLNTSYKILSNILLSRMTPYANEIIGEYQCGFTRNRSTVDHIFSIRQMLQKMWEYNRDVSQLFTDFEKAYHSIKRESFFDIIIKFGVPKKLEYSRHV